MKIIHLVPLFLLMSCTSMDIKTLDINTIQGLRGKVKEMDISSSRYQINETGTSEIYSLKTHSTIFFNKKRKGFSFLSGLGCSYSHNICDSEERKNLIQ